MRHRRRARKLSRNISARKALLKSLAGHLIEYYRIRTSLVKAKEARRVAERLIGFGKEGTLHARRKAYRVLNDRDKVKKLFTEVAPLFKEKAGGYTRIIRTYPRRGDGAEMVLLELTKQPVKAKEKKKTGKEKEEIKEAAKPEKKPRTEKPPKAEKKEEPETKVAPPPAHEKKAMEPRKEERPTKRPPKKGFFKNLRQHFKRKSMD